MTDYDAIDWGEMTALTYYNFTAPEYAHLPIRSPFTRAAKAETMLSDLNRLRSAIRSHDTFATEAALDQCERWFDQLEVKSKYD